MPGWSKSPGAWSEGLIVLSLVGASLLGVDAWLTDRRLFALEYGWVLVALYTITHFHLKCMLHTTKKYSSTVRQGGDMYQPWLSAKLLSTQRLIWTHLRFLLGEPTKRLHWSTQPTLFPARPWNAVTTGGLSASKVFSIFRSLVSWRRLQQFWQTRA